MFTMSAKQALDLWYELTEAYNGTNRYGGDEAEIYGYTLGDWPPIMRANNLTTPLLIEYQKEVAEGAARNLECVLEYFCKKYKDAVISIDGVKTLKAEPIVHRVHVKVEKQEEC